MGAHGLKVLVVEDDPSWRRTLCRSLRRLGVFEVVTTDRIGRGWALTREETWDGLVLDLTLPDGHGMELLEALRRERVRFPVLVQTATRDWTVANEVQRLGAQFLAKPFDDDHLAVFLEAAAASRARTNAAPDGLLLDLALRYGFTPTERTMLLLLARGMRRTTIADRRGVSENTVKTQIQTMLRKAEAGSVIELLGRALYPDDDESDEQGVVDLALGPMTLAPSH